MAALLAMRGIGVRYGATVALDEVDFTVAAGEVHALLGENGAGKSSLMQVLAGAVRPERGTMELDGVPFAPAMPRAARARGVAMVFQEPTVLSHLTVAENLWLGREPAHGGLVDRRRAADEARRLLLRLQRPDLEPQRRAATLSPADRQIVEIARALLGRARVLVLDEPTSSLGARDVERLFAIVARLRGEGLGIVWISHSLDEVRRSCDRCTVLRDGRVVAGGPLAELDDAALVRHMAGRPVERLFPAGGRAAGPAVLTVTGLAGDPLPRAASFVLHRGEIAGIAGLAGAGRSELLRAIFGRLPRAAGTVQLRGAWLPADPATCWQRGLGLLAEDRKHEGLALALPVATNVVLPVVARLRRRGLVRWAAARDAVRRFGARLQLRCRSPRMPARELSGGNQQKVALARLLHAGCDVLLLDEPTRGVDVGSRQEIYALLDELARGGAAILVVSSHLPELLGLCDRIAVMRRGELGVFRAGAAWTAEALLGEALGAGAEGGP